MDSKQLIGLILTLFGAVALGYGVISITGGEVANGQAWGAAILGGIFFAAGIGLMKTVKSSTADSGAGGNAGS